MRVTIWQQFSSNHSSSFTVVGQFETIADAQRAEAKFRAIFNQIAEASNHDSDAPSWYEEALMREYELDWDKGIKWIDNTQDHVIRYENYVFLTTALASVWTSPDIIEQLMHKFTPHVHTQNGEAGRPDAILLTHITCHAPDEESGLTLYHAIKQYFDDTKQHDEIVPPWEGFAQNANYKLPFTGVMGGKIERYGAWFKVIELAFFDTHDGLPAFIAYLTDKGCTKIEYRISSVPYASRPEYL